MTIRYTRVLPALLLAVAVVMPSIDFAQEEVDVQVDRKERANALREQRDAARDKREAIKKELNEKRDVARDAAQEAKERFQEKRTDLRNASLDALKTAMHRAVDFQIKHIESAKARINNLDNVSDDVKAGVISELDDLIERVSSFKAEIDAATTREELKAVASNLRGTLKEHKDMIKRIVGTLKVNRGSRILERANERVDAIDSRLTDIEADGVDVSKLRVELDAARADFAAAESLLSSDIPAAISSMKEGYAHLKSLVSLAKELDKASPQTAG